MTAPEGIDPRGSTLDGLLSDVSEGGTVSRESLGLLSEVRLTAFCPTAGTVTGTRFVSEGRTLSEEEAFGMILRGAGKGHAVSGISVGKGPSGRGVLTLSVILTHEEEGEAFGGTRFLPGKEEAK